MNGKLQWLVSGVLITVLTYAAYEIGRVHGAAEAQAASRPVGASPQAAQEHLPLADDDHEASMRREVEPVQPDVRVAEPAKASLAESPEPTTRETSTGGKRRFLEAAFYVSSAEFNPTGKQFDRAQTVALENVINELGRDLRGLLQREAMTAQKAADEKMASGNYRQLALGESAAKSRDSLVSQTMVGADGIIRNVEVFPGESIELDQVTQQRVELYDNGLRQIQQWIASH